MRSTSARQCTVPTRASEEREIFGVTITVGGPLVSDDGATSIGSLMVLETSDRASAEKFNRADPFHQNGVGKGRDPAIRP